VLTGNGDRRAVGFAQEFDWFKQSGCSFGKCIGLEIKGSSPIVNKSFTSFYINR
jgi:hypothetical protein